MKALLAFALLALTAVRGAETITIKTAQEFIQFSKNVNAGSNKDATVFLENDIDFTGLSDQFQAIGITGTSYFSGVFDGQGHTISHLVLKNTGSWDFGLFTRSNGVTIRNLVMDSTCSLTTPSGSGPNGLEDGSVTFGGIIGQACASFSDTLIENNVFMGNMEYAGLSTTTSKLAIGGIAGETWASGPVLTVRNCANYGTVTFSGAFDSTSIGGIVGYNLVTSGQATTTYIYNCLNYGAIAHTGDTRNTLYVGGIFGGVGSGAVEIDNAVNFGSVSVNAGASTRRAYVGTLVGGFFSTKLANSYWVNGSKYDLVGMNPSSPAITQCTNFSSSTLTLLRTVKVGGYSGTLLTKALNAGADVHSAQKYSKWLSNRNGNVVAFAVNGETPFVKTKLQVILMPTLADGVEKKFDGWYTDKACTAKLAKFEITANTNLYGKFK